MSARSFGAVYQATGEIQNANFDKKVLGTHSLVWHHPERIDLQMLILQNCVSGKVCFLNKCT